MLLIAAMGLVGVRLIAPSVAAHRRTRTLADMASRQRMRFSHEASIEVLHRYPGLFLARLGHDLRVANLCEGRAGGRTVRTFDLEFDAGRGPRRMHKRFAVAAAEGGSPLPPLWMWPGQAQSLLRRPAAAEDRIGGWCYSGSRELAASLAEAISAPGAGAVSVQTAGRAVVLSAPVNGTASDDAIPCLWAAEALEAIDPRNTIENEAQP